MLTNVLKETTDLSIGVSGALICVGTAIILGLVISLIYMLSDKKKQYSTNFALTLAILPAIVCIVIMVIGTDIARAISLGGVFTLVRFRSVPGNSKDITSIFFAMAVGLTAGVGYAVLAAIITVVIGALYLTLTLLEYGKKNITTKKLKITIPENLNFNGAFDDLFEEYAKNSELQSVKTTNLGTLFELTYSIDLKADADEKKFIDALRCRNGNLNIILCKMQENIEQL